MVIQRKKFEISIARVRVKGSIIVKTLSLWACEIGGEPTHMS